MHITIICGLEQRSRYSDSLRVNSPGIEFPWERDLPHPPRPVLRPTQYPIQWVPDLIPEDKAARACR